jgi:hypothetical protein
MEPIITVDDDKLTQHDLGQLISTHSQGTRMEVTPEEQTHRTPSWR